MEGGGHRFTKLTECFFFDPVVNVVAVVSELDQAGLYQLGHMSGTRGLRKRQGIHDGMAGHFLLLGQMLENRKPRRMGQCFREPGQTHQGIVKDFKFRQRHIAHLRYAIMGGKSLFRESSGCRFFWKE